MKQWSGIFKKRGKVFTKIDENMPKLLELFKKNKVKRILDLGFGSGRHAVYFAKHGFDVYGIDIAEGGLDITNSWLEKEKVAAKLKIGSIYDSLPYGDNFFDAVISTQSIHHGKIEDVRKCIKEVERILKPKGLLFITVRKRKFKKEWKIGTVVKKYGKQRSDYKIIAPRTYIPTEGGEKGMPHYLFNMALLKKEFKHFKIYNIWTTSLKIHYCLLGELKK